MMFGRLAAKAVLVGSLGLTAVGIGVAPSAMAAPRVPVPACGGYYGGGGGYYGGGCQQPMPSPCGCSSSFGGGGYYGGGGMSPYYGGGGGYYGGGGGPFPFMGPGIGANLNGGYNRIGPF